MSGVAISSVGNNRLFGINRLTNLMCQMIDFSDVGYAPPVAQTQQHGNTNFIMKEYLLVKRR